MNTPNMSLEDLLTKAIRYIQENHCLKCKFGKALVQFKALRDESELETQGSSDSGISPSMNAIPDKPSLVQPEVTKPANTAVTPDSKKCKDCGKVKPVEEFYKHEGMSDGRQNRCRDCIKAKHCATKSQSPVPDASRTRGPDLPFVCDTCHCKFQTRKKLDDHDCLGTDIQRGPRKFSCGECDKVFGTKEGLRQHRELRHAS